MCLLSYDLGSQRDEKKTLSGGENYANLSEFYKIIQQDEKSDLLTSTQILLF